MNAYLNDNVVHLYFFQFHLELPLLIMDRISQWRKIPGDTLLYYFPKLLNIMFQFETVLQCFWIPFSSDIMAETGDYQVIRNIFMQQQWSY